MAKPSRRCRPLLCPLPLRHLRFTRFILSHPRPVRLRMGAMGRQIRCSEPMGNISKLERGRSPVTSGRTCQTLTSSSKVESAASMSGKGEIRFDADPIQGAPGGPEQVAQVSKFEETAHRGSSSPPPLDLINYPDEFKSLGWDRLRPYMKTTDPSALEQYLDYLSWFYYSHKDPAPVASLADAASMCLDKENSMMSFWCSVNACCCNSNGYNAAQFIAPYMHTVIKEKGGIHPFGIDTAMCIAKEAELISEWLRRERRLFIDDEYVLCHDIRAVAARFFISDRKWSVHVAAAFLGIRKEAEWLIERSKCNSDESISTSMKIRQSALLFVWEKLNEREIYENDFIQSEMAYEIDDESNDESDESNDESDDDVAESKENDYVGGCCDEDYMKLYL